VSSSHLPTEARPTPAPAAADPGRLLPGTVVAGRYRVISPLGRGGMGEVYRADDLKLAQPVALKFLPPGLRGDTDRRTRLLNEVKLARQVAHPSVCHVWDVGEVDGHDFLSMEYVDGEDLASLLRRIGRLPEDRAVVMARELCAGLGAVHEQGLLHRDLKPANVMIDGRGRVKLADFGLAAAAQEVAGAEIRSGTPAYMSPEQLAGREVTIRSDVYALGLVLYELFTGHPAYPSGSVEETAQLRSQSEPASPSSHVKGLDPAVDRVIQRCLSPDPSRRPPTASAVATALPGGDPLAAAVAAGETPSPEMVAAAGGRGGLSPALAAAAVAAIFGGIGLAAWIADRATPFYASLDEPSEVLEHDARELMASLQPPDAPAGADRAHGFARSDDGLGSLFFWYRDSPRSFAKSLSLSLGGLSFTNPPATEPGAAGVRLDPHGRLVEYLRTPRAREPPASGPLDWADLSRRAGLDPASLRTVAPEALPPVFADARTAFETEDGAIRVEAASFRERPVWFLAGPKGAKTPASGGMGAGIYLFCGLFVAAAVLARRNLRLGRGDRQGALKVTAAGLIISVVGFGLLNDLRYFRPELVIFTVALSLFFTAFYGAAYLALEPTVRRRWPATLGSWSRLLAGRGRDPLVGRDVLLGTAAGVGLALIEQASRWWGVQSSNWAASPELLMGGWKITGSLVRGFGPSILTGLLILLILVLVQMLVRRTWMAVALTGAVLVPLMGSLGSAAEVVASVLFVGLFLALLIRSGLLTAVIAYGVHTALAHQLMTTHLGAWYADSAVGGILSTLLLTAWGLHAALRGRSTGRLPSKAEAIT
jgi:serine/threonine-protein kinase